MLWNNREERSGTRPGKDTIEGSGTSCGGESTAARLSDQALTGSRDTFFRRRCHRIFTFTIAITIVIIVSYQQPSLMFQLSHACFHTSGMLFHGLTRMTREFPPTEWWSSLSSYVLLLPTEAEEDEVAEAESESESVEEKDVGNAESNDSCNALRSNGSCRAMLGAAAVVIGVVVVVVVAVDAAGAVGVGVAADENGAEYISGYFNANGVKEKKKEKEVYTSFHGIKLIRHPPCKKKKKLTH
ncbi:hypothetical protein BDA99DRAFT_357156 [Phascolomyces articulosus]|uniref:Transmembrane protein n=1 Tax=Phascolomyces articulosus TaxID=60185 RepID=A0AAD5KE48_9FUNG|nr:hypothetical protein BDA99DRAFT_357156 [Phascolomyces articulosus]